MLHQKTVQLSDNLYDGISDKLYDRLFDENPTIITSALSTINSNLNYTMERKVNIFTSFKFRHRYTKLLTYDHEKITKTTLKILLKIYVINQNKNVRDRNSDVFKALTDFMKKQKSFKVKLVYLKGLKEIKEHMLDGKAFIEETYTHYLSHQTKGERFFLKLAITGQDLFNFKF